MYGLSERRTHPEIARLLPQMSRCYALILLVSMLLGCAAVYPPGVSQQPPVRTLETAVGAGETQRNASPAPPEYRINPGDVLTVRFPRRPAYNETFVIRADGRIMAPQVGPVMAAARTAEELQSDLSAKYRQLLAALPRAQDRSYRLQPDDTIEVRFSYFPDLDSVVTIRPDGRISLPMIGEVIAEAATPSELQTQLAKRYAPRIAKPDLVVMVKETRSNIYFHDGAVHVLPDPGLVDLMVNITKTAPLIVYVGGEVPAPGVQPFVTGNSALQAIYSAGGPSPTGDMRSVVILRRGKDDQVIRAVVDLTQDLAGNGTENVTIQPFDVVVVPRSNIAQVGDALDQYVYRIARPLANSSVGFYFTRQVGTVKQETEIR